MGKPRSIYSMGYKDFNFYDFLKDRFFVEWIKNPNKESNSFWEEWMKRNPEKKEEISKARAIILRLKYADEKASSSESNEVLEKILMNLDNDSPTSSRFTKNNTHFNWRSIAASILVLASITWGYLLFENNQEKIVIDNTNPEEWIERHTPIGSKSTLRLQDGTVVYLNAETTLKIPKQFAPNKRIVYLTGEAFFDVAEDKTRPFTIYSGSLSTTALGTSFNVRAYPEEQKLSVALVTGKVEVDNFEIDTSEILIPNEQLVYNVQEQESIKQHFDTELVTGWHKGLLIFQNSDFNDVVEKLERWYGVSFEIQKLPTYQKEYRGRFNNQSLEEVLQVMSFTSGFSYIINDKNVIIN